MEAEGSNSVLLDAETERKRRHGFNEEGEGEGAGMEPCRGLKQGLTERATADRDDTIATTFLLLGAKIRVSVKHIYTYLHTYM